MENKIKAIEEQIDKLRGEREKVSREEHRSKKRILQQKLTLDLLDRVIVDLENRQKDLARAIQSGGDL